MSSVSAGYIGGVIVNLFIFILLAAVYTYIVKLENAGCACANHPNKNFIKNFSVFALIFLLIVTFIPTSTLITNFGTTVAGVFAFVRFIFNIVFIIYLFLTLEYTRYLINEKCKCSEGMQREFIMVGVIIEFVIMLLALLVIILLPIIFNSVNIVVQNMDDFEKDVSNTIKNPYTSIKNVPKKLSKATKMVKGIGSKSMTAIKKMSKPKKY